MVYDRTVTESRDFTISGVFRETFRVLKTHGTTILILAAVLVALPTVLMLVIGLEWPSSPGQTARDILTRRQILNGIGSFLSAIGGVVLQGAIYHAAYAGRDNSDVTVSKCIGAGARVFWPIAGIAILISLGIMFGFILLVVPGIMLSCRWIVSAPAYVAERPGVFGAMKRSAGLTKGYRWRIFGLGLLYFVIAALLFAVVILAFLPFAAAGVQLARGGSVVAEIAQIILNLLFTIFFNATVAAIYLELRRVKEGALTSDMAAVFD